LDDGTVIDARATVLDSPNVDPRFGSRGDIVNVNIAGNGVDGSGINTVIVLWEFFIQGTDTPANGNFTFLVTDLDANESNPDDRFESIGVPSDSLDGYVLSGGTVEETGDDTITDPETDIVVTEVDGNTIFRPTDGDNGTPGLRASNAVQLTFTNTSSVEIIYNRNRAGANFGLDGNFEPGFFASTVIVDTNPDFANIFTEGDAPISIVSENIQITDELDSIASATIEITNAEVNDIIAVTGTLPISITATVNSPTSITLNGVGTADDYENAISAITFENTSDQPNDNAIREIDIKVTDNEALVSNTATSFIQVVEIPTDTDGDGVEDSIDIDDDNDGILDIDEAGRRYIFCCRGKWIGHGLYHSYARHLIRGWFDTIWN